MQTKAVIALAAVAIGILPGIAHADEFLYCQPNGRAFVAVTKPDNTMVFADAGHCSGGAWGVWLKLIPAGDTATAETDWAHDENAGRAYAILGKIHHHSVHWLKASPDVVAAFDLNDVKATLVIRADHLPDHVIVQVWPAAPQ